MGIRITRNGDRDITVESDTPSTSAHDHVQGHSDQWNYAMRELGMDSVEGSSYQEIRGKIEEENSRKDRVGYATMMDL